MKYPWSIYPNLWQNSDFITTQMLTNIDEVQQNQWQWMFNYSPIKNYYGVHHIKYNTNQISLGKILIEEIQCTFPNGQHFNYNNQWQRINNQEYIGDIQNKIYELECNLENYSNLFNNRPWIEMGLIIEQNSFDQDNFFIISSAMRSINDINDINNVNIRMPWAKLIPLNLIKNNISNYLPLFRINITNGIFSIMDYQYPIIFINNQCILGKSLTNFLDQLYTKIIYVHKENKNAAPGLQIFLQNVMTYVFSLQSLLKNDLLTTIEWYKKSLILLGQLEGLMDFNCKTYFFYPKDLMESFNIITQRILDICENFYIFGEILTFQWIEETYELDINFPWDNNKIYMDFSGTVEKHDLINWVENSIIDNKDNLEVNKINKDRGLDRQLMDSKINSDNNSVWLRYKIENNYIENHKLCVFNPINISNLKINLIKK